MRFLGEVVDERVTFKVRGRSAECGEGDKRRGFKTAMREIERISLGPGERG